MTNFEETEVYYFLGIGGIGMSAIARYFHAQGKLVMGYDRTSTPLTTELEMEGIPIHFDDSVLEIPPVIRHTPREKVLVIYTPAIPKNSIELNWLHEHGYTIIKRSQALGVITAQSKSIAVAGTHGKTTTSAMIAHLLKHSGKGCNAFLGGIATNYATNLLLDTHAEWTVVEADEYDRSFLTLTPRISVITSTDADHLDIYGSHEYMKESFNLFAQKLNSGGLLIHRKGLPIDTSALEAGVVHADYSATEAAAHNASSVEIRNGHYYFDYTNENERWPSIELGLPGMHNVENAVAAIAVCRAVGLTEEQIRTGLSSFAGVKRRFEYHLRRDDVVLIDDYAHHPEELRACISSVRQLYPEKHITGVFQPHLFSRTRDFLADFARSLELLDDIILLPIYPARELPIAGIDSQLLLDNISKPTKKLVEKHDLLAELTGSPRQVIVMLGAGDIDALVSPVATAFSV
ncbi:MAG: UDP-N-acetylmuramate--L-alanine ligase [Flavobacteriales bacterium]